MFKIWIALGIGGLIVELMKYAQHACSQVPVINCKQINHTKICKESRTKHLTSAASSVDTVKMACLLSLLKTASFNW